MKKTLSINTLYVVCLITSIAIPGASSANLIVNGSFESFSGTTILSTQPDRLFNNNSGSFNVPGWNFDVGFTSDIYRGMSAPGAISNHYQASDGNYFAGSYSREASVVNGIHEGVAQTFSVNPNTTYELSFDLAPGGIFYETYWLEYPTVGPAGWDVSISGALTSNISQSFSTNIGNFNPSITTNPINWESGTLIFTSDNAGGTVDLKFVSFADNAQVFLDNVIVIETSAVPIPAAIWLFGSGLIGLLTVSGCSRT